MQLFKNVKKSLRLKLLLGFIFVGILPLIILLTYTLFLSETKIVKRTVQEQFMQADNIAHQIDTHLRGLEKELGFIASLDLMDDIVADDIDKRISRLLIKKVQDLGLDVSLFVVNEHNQIIATNEKTALLKSFSLQDNKKHYFFKNNQLYIFSPIYASFDSSKKLGFLVLRYALKNLTSYLTHQIGKHSYLSNKNGSLRVGDHGKFAFEFTKKRASVKTEEHLIVYEKLDNFLSDYYLVYAVDKSIALKFLNEYIRFILYISIFIVLVVIAISLFYSRSIVRPIESLTVATKQITKEQEYSYSLEVKSQDEIGLLTRSFNDMIETTAEALERLEEENKLRLRRFIQLIEVFNTIIQTEDEEECMEVSIQEIKKITDKEDLAFVRMRSEHSIDLYVTDFEKKEKIYFGSISQALKHFKDDNERSFYHSIASMIMLQLDRIRLISRTMAASRAKSAFISNMSHELRTPLNAIIGFSQFMITYEDMTEEQEDTVANIESSAHYLLDMINEILDIAKIEAGKMEAHKEEVSLTQILNNIYNMLKPLSDDKGLELLLNTENFSQDIVYTDPKMFQQIVTNLLSNAIKFTEKGFIKTEITNDADTIIIKIVDSGIGISSVDLEKLFNDFTQVENVMQKKHKGTGLGLSLSKKMAELLGMELTLESEGLGKGTQACLIFSNEPNDV